MASFKYYSKTQLKQLIKDYNIHHHIKGYYKMSKPLLIQHIEKHLTHDENDTIISINGFKGEIKYNNDKVQLKKKELLDFMKLNIPDIIYAMKVILKENRMKFKEYEMLQEHLEDVSYSMIMTLLNKYDMPLKLIYNSI